MLSVIVIACRFSEDFASSMFFIHQYDSDALHYIHMQILRMRIGANSHTVPKLYHWEFGITKSRLDGCAHMTQY
jgi:hypothetical protein